MSRSVEAEQTEECPICRLPFTDQEVATPSSCKHCYCFDCLIEWSKRINTCPVDRLSFNMIDVRPIISGKVTRQVTVERTIISEEEDDEESEDEDEDGDNEDIEDSEDEDEDAFDEESEDVVEKEDEDSDDNDDEDEDDVNLPYMYDPRIVWINNEIRRNNEYRPVDYYNYLFIR